MVVQRLAEGVDKWVPNWSIGGSIIIGFLVYLFLPSGTEIAGVMWVIVSIGVFVLWLVAGTVIRVGRRLQNSSES